MKLYRLIPLSLRRSAKRYRMVPNQCAMTGIDPCKTDSFWTDMVANECLFSYANWRRNFDGLFSALLFFDLDRLALRTFLRRFATSEVNLLISFLLFFNSSLLFLQMDHHRIYLGRLIGPGKVLHLFTLI